VGWPEGAPGDDALIAAVGEQDHEALGEIYRRHGGAVWAVAKRICPSAELATEVSQTVFTDLWSHPERFEPSSRVALRAWLLAQAHSRAVAAVRSGEGRRPPGNAPSAATPTPTPPSAEVETTVHAADLPKEARRAIDQLPAGERDAILLAYVGGHTCGETARLLGTSEDIVKSRIRHGLLNLRRALEAEGVNR
jgi:RNA polymerase sigma-70 factor, ECF subfamily